MPLGHIPSTRPIRARVSLYEFLAVIHVISAAVGFPHKCPSSPHGNIVEIYALDLVLHVMTTSLSVLSGECFALSEESLQRISGSGGHASSSGIEALCFPMDV